MNNGEIEAMITVFLAAHEFITDSSYQSFFIPIHGEPSISYVLKNEISKQNKHIVVVEDKNIKLIEFIKRFYSNVSLIKVNRVEIIDKFGDFNILTSLYMGICNIKYDQRIKIVMGDTICQYKMSDHDNFIVVSEEVFSSERWALVEEEDGILQTIYDKMPDVELAKKKIFAGVMEISSVFCIKKCIEDLINDGASSIADLIKSYNMINAIYCHECSFWCDFGHRSGLIKATDFFYNSRYFNSLTTRPELSLICKSSENIQKLQDEHDWYKNIPNEILFLVPRTFPLVSYDNYARLDMELYGYPTLSELFIFGNLKIEEWILILERLFKTIKILQSYKGHLSRNEYYELYINKTWKRYEDLKSQDICWDEIISYNSLIINGKTYKNINEQKKSINRHLNNIIKNATTTIMHGDYCLSNILFDINTSIIKLIDPRGRIISKTIYGDARYDIAKLRHSIVGLYDFIVHGYFDIDHNGNEFTYFIDKPNFYNDLILKFDEFIEINLFNITQIKLIEAILFLSMIPLHCDSVDRQKIFYCIAVQKLNDIMEEL